MLILFLNNLKNTFTYTLENQLGKSLWSVLIETVPMFILNFLTRTPESVYNDYNRMILTKDYKDIDQMFIIKRKKWNYIAVIIFALILHFTAWYYVTIFCSIYTKSSVSWICGGIISMIINYFIVQPLIPFLKAIFRWMTYKFQKK